MQEKDDRMSGRYDETLCCCALNMIFGYEPKISHALVEALGSAAAVFSLDREGLDTVFGPYSVHRSRISPKALDDASLSNEVYNQNMRSALDLALREAGFVG